MRNKIIIGLIFFFSTAASQAQKNRFIPPDMTQKTHSFALPELQVDSIFIENLNTVLFDKNDRHMNSIMSNPHEKLWRHFHIHFEKEDSFNYSIVASLWDIPARKSIGFFEYKGFLYWFGYDAPPNIILKKNRRNDFHIKSLFPPHTTLHFGF